MGYNIYDALDLIAEGRDLMFKVHHRNSGSQNESDVHLGIFQSETLVRAATKDKIIFRIRISRTLLVEPSFGLETVGFSIDLRIMQRVVE